MFKKRKMRILSEKINNCIGEIEGMQAQKDIGVEFFKGMEYRYLVIVHNLAVMKHTLDILMHEMDIILYGKKKAFINNVQKTITKRI